MPSWESDEQLEQYVAPGSKDGPKGDLQARFDGQLGLSGLTVDDVRSDLTERIAQPKRFDLLLKENGGEVSEEEERETYEEQPGLFGVPESRTIEILGTTSETAADDARDRIEKVASLPEVSSSVSTDLAMRSAGREIPVTEREGSLPEEIDQAVFGAEPTELVGPVAADGYFYPFEVTSIDQADLPPFEEVRDEAIEQAAAAEISRLQLQERDQL
jgi:parvulin-like peptidyl-prolyl isomerase